MRLSVRKAATKRVGYTITRWDMRGTPTIQPPPIGRLRASLGSPLASPAREARYDRVPDERLAARKRRDPGGDSLKGLSIERSPRRPPAASTGRCGHVTPCIESRRIIISWSCLATEVSFIVIFFPPSGSKEGGYPTTGRGVSLQVYEAASSS